MPPAVSPDDVPMTAIMTPFGLFDGTQHEHFNDSMTKCYMTRPGKVMDDLNFALLWANPEASM